MKVCENVWISEWMNVLVVDFEFGWVLVFVDVKVIVFDYFGNVFI